MTPQKRQRLASLRRLCAAWYRDQSGVVRSPKVPGKAIIVQGRARSPEALSFLDRALYCGELVFHQAEIYGQAAKLSLDKVLWTQGQALSNPQAIAQATHAILVVQANQSFFEYLPLSKDLLRLVRGDHKPWESLGFVLNKEELELGRIDRELGTLVAMGMCRLRAPGKHAPPPRRDTPGAKSAPKPGPPRAEVRRMMAERRLRREWTQLANADDYTLLGVAQSADAATVERACKRMRKRYAGLSRERAMTPEARALARKIHERIQAAIQRVQTGQPRTAAHALLESPEQALEQGKELARQGNWTAAITCLTAASKISRDPDAEAWLGFAHFHDLRHPREEREARAREMLVLAESLGAPSATKLRRRLPPVRALAAR